MRPLIKISRLLFLLLLLTSGISGCYYDIAEELYPSSLNCDTTTVTFSADINPILQQKCIACHRQGANQGNVNLEGYAQAKIYADNGKLLGSISHSTGFAAMPQGEGKLSSCSIDKVRAWINRGATNN